VVSERGGVQQPCETLTANSSWEMHACAPLLCPSLFASASCGVLPFPPSRTTYNSW